MLFVIYGRSSSAPPSERQSAWVSHCTPDGVYFQDHLKGMMNNNNGLKKEPCGKSRMMGQGMYMYILFCMSMYFSCLISQTTYMDQWYPKYEFSNIVFYI